MPSLTSLIYELTPANAEMDDLEVRYLLKAHDMFAFSTVDNVAKEQVSLQAGKFAPCSEVSYS